MPGPLNEDDRRRNPRFNCGGEVKLNCLPSDGAVVPGKLQNLSLGGVCVDTIHPIAPGARAEILVNVNAASFRTVGLVKTLEGTRTSLEFVQMSAGSKAMLADLLEHLARLQSMMVKLRSSRVPDRKEMSRELDGARIRAALLGEPMPAFAAFAADTVRDLDETPRAEPEKIVKLLPLVVKVDLFG